MADRRRHRRYPHAGPVTYRRLGASTPGRVGNISEGGLMIELEELISPGTPLDLVISLGEQSVRAEVEVIWSNVSPDTSAATYRHGCKFTRLELHDRLSLAVFIAKNYGG